MKKGELLRVTIDNLEPDGCGYAEVDGREIKVKGTLPGDVVNVYVFAVRRHTTRVGLESVISEGVKRIDAPCAHFGQCGGCRWQNIPYDIQCGLKINIIKDSLGKITEFEPVDNIEIVSSPDVYFYRNKMEFSFDRPPKEEYVKLGLHESGRYDRVFDVTKCYLQSEISNRIIAATREFVHEYGLSAYGLKSHDGLLRYLMIRDGKNTGEVMVYLVTSQEDFGFEKQFYNHLLNVIPEITTLIRSINSGSGSVSSGEEHRIIYGDGKLNDKIGKFCFAISPDSFFQTNTRQAEHLYDFIDELCNLSGTENVLDLYCGTGTIGIYLAKRAKHVTGVEIVENAVRDAELNAERNGISNINFVTGPAEKTIGEFMGDFDVIVCDPPRVGIHPKAMKQLVRMRIPRMVYVSCNIKAAILDIEMLMLAGYRVKRLKVFDMSPHTPHIETVFLLEIE